MKDLLILIILLLILIFGLKLSFIKRWKNVCFNVNNNMRIYIMFSYITTVIII